jgi:hypothetical protein
MWDGLSLNGTSAWVNTAALPDKEFQEYQHRQDTYAAEYPAPGLLNTHHVYGVHADYASDTSQEDSSWTSYHGLSAPGTAPEIAARADIICWEQQSLREYEVHSGDTYSLGTLVKCNTNIRRP